MQVKLVRESLIMSTQDNKLKGNKLYNLIFNELENSIDIIYEYIISLFPNDKVHIKPIQHGLLLNWKNNTTYIKIHEDFIDDINEFNEGFLVIKSFIEENQNYIIIKNSKTLKNIINKYIKKQQDFINDKLIK